MANAKTWYVPEVVYRDFVWNYNPGICLACGECTQSGVEPDARNYECEACEEKAVYGFEEAVMMGRLTFDKNANEASY